MYLMSERECLKAIYLILQRFNAVDRLGSDGSDGTSETSSEGSPARDAPSGAHEEQGSDGDADDGGGRSSSECARFIERTRPKARRSSARSRRG